MADIAAAPAAAAVVRATMVAGPRKAAAKKKGSKTTVRKSPAAKTVKSKSAAVSSSPKIPRVSKSENEHPHPPYMAMVKEALTKLHDRKGTSTQAIQKHIGAQYNIDTNKMVKKHIGTALKKGVSTGILTQSSGTGLNGRFRLTVGPSKARNSQVAREENAIVPAHPSADSGRPTAVRPAKKASGETAAKNSSTKRSKKAAASTKKTTA